MNKETKKEKKFRIKRSLNIGAPDAETDQFLLDAFVDIINVDEIIDTSNQKSILIGRTGSGKSAILEYLKKYQKNICDIAPEEMSLRFLSNSSIIKYFRSHDVNLYPFYKVLWRHVFLVELLKLYFGDQPGEKKNTFFEAILSKLSNSSKKDPKRERALKYMKEWSNDFWQQTEYRVKSFENKIISNFASQMGIDITKVMAKISGDSSEQNTTFVEVKQKAESVIHDSQVIEIIDLIRVMENDFFVSHQKKYYIIIDDLDKEWIEDEMRYELIGAMIEVIKEFRRLKGVKIIIALRENLNDLIFSGLKNRGGQREKIRPLFSYLEWAEEDLKTLLDNRLQLMSESKLNVRTAFYSSRRGNTNGFQYVLERTFHRPRDIISFINHAIENSESKSMFTKDILAKAEPSYSKDRFQALDDEWSENFGNLESFTGFLKNINDGFKLKSVNEDHFMDLYITEVEDLQVKGEVYNAVIDWKDGRINFISFLKKVIFVLYRIGVLGVKKGPTYRNTFYYNSDVLIDKNDISNKCKFYVHPALYSNFSVNVIDQLPE